MKTSSMSILKLIPQNVCSFLGTFLVMSSSYAVASNYGNSNGNNNDMEPKVIAKISPSAVDKAMSPDGLKGIFGLYFGPQKFENSIATNNKELSQKTQKKISVFGLALGAEYAKSFKNNLFLGVGILLDIGPKKKQSGTWSSINDAFDKSINTVQYPGERKGQISTEFFTPSIGFKVGYRFRKLRSTLYLKLALSRLAGQYTYYLAQKKFEDSKVNTIVLSGGLGGEYRLNKKLGVGFEIGAPFQRKTNKKTLHNIEQISKMSRVEFRALMYYTIAGGADADLSSNYLKQ